MDDLLRAFLRLGLHAPYVDSRTWVRFSTAKKTFLPKYSDQASAAPPNLCSSDFLAGSNKLNYIWGETDIAFYSRLAYK